MTNLSDRIAKAVVPFAVDQLPWRDMETAPKDGSIIAVCYHEWDVKTNPMRMQFAQWINVGDGGKWCQPYNTSNETFADGWMPLSEIGMCPDSFRGRHD